MKLILGSKSPRRKELLNQLGFDFEVKTKDTDESYPSDIKVEDVALYVANKKAMDLKIDLSNDEILICADTIVILDNQIMGKPSSREEALNMLKLLSGRKHAVITGVVLTSFAHEVMFSCTTNVSVTRLSIDTIQYYVDHFKPYDKAGSYGVQEWFGLTCIERIEGSYSNIMGLPTHEVYEALKNFNNNLSI